MAWVLAPTIPGLPLPPNWTWEGGFPEGELPPPPAYEGFGVPDSGVPVPGDALTGPALPVVPSFPDPIGLPYPPGVGVALPSGAAGVGSILLLALGAWALSKMTGRR